MSDFDVEFVGDKPGDIEKRLSKLGVRGQTRANRALVKTGEEVQEELESTSPVDTGEYQASWYMMQVAEDEVWILNEADHAKYVMLPNQVMVNSTKADLPGSGILHDVKGVAKSKQKSLNLNFADELKKMIKNLTIKQMVDYCWKCGEGFEKITTHWSTNSFCSHPKFTTKQKKILEGLLMSDGCIHRPNDGNPAFVCNMQEESIDYLKYLDEVFGCLSRGVRLSSTGEDNAANLMENGYRENVNPENYSDIYRFETISHPGLKYLAEWYQTGKKIWPCDDIDISPILLKHLYVGDGCRKSIGGHEHAEISMKNEVDRQEKVCKMFERAGFSDFWFETGDYGYGEEMKLVFSSESSKEFWDYISPTLPSFEYKWPEEYHND